MRLELVDVGCALWLSLRSRARCGAVGWMEEIERSAVAFLGDRIPMMGEMKFEVTGWVDLERLPGKTLVASDTR